MPELVLSVLGSYRLSLSGQPVKGFMSDKVRALLAYLMLEAKQTHQREQLVGLFWPQNSERKARQSLSQALSNLRRLLKDQGRAEPFILADYHRVQFNPANDYELDVDRLMVLGWNF